METWTKPKLHDLGRQTWSIRLDKTGSNIKVGLKTDSNVKVGQNTALTLHLLMLGKCIKRMLMIPRFNDAAADSKKHIAKPLQKKETSTIALRRC